MRRVVAGVASDDPAALTRAAEVFGRALAGLALDDIDGVLVFEEVPDVP